MSTVEALVVTALGMSAVFIGLLLCIAFIQLFNRLSTRIPAHGVVPAAIGPPAVAGGPPVDPEVVAVIAAVIEVERALYVGRARGRLTIRRGDGAQPRSGGAS